VAKRAACVGSRALPEEAANVMLILGSRLATLGWEIHSGDAEGSDRKWHEGFMQSPLYTPSRAFIYLAWNGVGNRYHDPENGFYDATQFENYGDARALALEARGSFEGLGRGGIALHSRNPYQVLTETLNDPVDTILFYAQPVGKAGKVKGGTNTAVALALKHNVTAINLYTEEGLRRVESFMTKSKTKAEELLSEYRLYLDRERAAGETAPTG